MLGLKQGIVKENTEVVPRTEYSKPNILVKASCIGNLLVPLLLKNKKSLGKVTNIFGKTLNIKMDDDEILVITCGSLCSPINVNISFENSVSFKELVKSGSEVSIDDHHRLLIGNLAISFEGSKKYRNQLEEPSIEGLMRFVDKIGQLTLALNMLAREGCLINPDHTTKNLLKDFLEGLQLIKNELGTAKSIDKLSSMLKAMCGIGPGFTPAGDDFIMGYLSMHNYLSKISGLNRIEFKYDELRGCTTWISTKMIQCSQRSLHDEVVELALNSVARGDVSSYISALIELGPRGHTSGIDLATGMTVSLFTVCDLRFRIDCLSTLEIAF